MELEYADENDIEKLIARRIVDEEQRIPLSPVPSKKAKILQLDWKTIKTQLRGLDGNWRKDHYLWIRYETQPLPKTKEDSFLAKNQYQMHPPKRAPCVQSFSK